MNARITVIIITFRRADYVRRCLEDLFRQDEPAEQVIVVDASDDDLTADVVAAFEDVTYVRNPAGAWNMTSSRNIGLRVARGEIIAFLDDDAFPEPPYIRELRRAYADPSVALACSRTLNGQPGEATQGDGGVGQLTADGELIGNFAFDASPAAILDIDHGIGATMSFRRSTLSAMGGFREDYSGVSGVREDTDAFLRARRLGFRAVYINGAVAHHVGAPQAKGKRFDLRYQYWASRNHALVLINNFGLLDRRVIRSVSASIRATLSDQSRSLQGRLVRTAVGVFGFLRGVGIVLYRQRGRSLPARLDGTSANALRVQLAEAGASTA